MFLLPMKTNTENTMLSEVQQGTWQQEYMHALASQMSEDFSILRMMCRVSCTFTISGGSDSRRTDC